jgi:hypothetical protein
MFNVDCVISQKPDTMAQAINDKISTLTSSGYKVLNVYPITIGDFRYVSAIINYDTSPTSDTQYVTTDTLNRTLAAYAKKSDISTLPNSGGT